MRKFGAVLAILLLAPCVSRAQTLANADTVEAYGLTLIGGLEKFSYGPQESIQPVLWITNPTDEAIVVPGAQFFCAMAFVEEDWCRTDGTRCIETGRMGECLPEDAQSIPPGTHEGFVVGNGCGSGSQDWIHTSGRVRIWDPWGSPWNGAPAFELVVTFQRTAPVAVQPVQWQHIKELYR